jgi:hypothetical protein
MAFKFRRGNNDFAPLGRPSDITETQYGYAENGEINYPGVSTCTTVTLLLDNTAIGMHLTKADLPEVVDAIIKQLNVLRAGRPVRKMYVVGALLSNQPSGWKCDGRYAWPTQLNTFNTAFGRNAGDPVSGYIQADGCDQDYRGVVTTGAEMDWSARAKGSQVFQRLVLTAGSLQVAGIK